MAKVTGWIGNLLRVNLTTGNITVEDSMKYKDLVGGAGLGYKVIFDEVPQGTKAFDEANKVVIAVGPLTGTAAPCSGRTNITSLAPTNPYHAITDSHMGGNFGPWMKFAGYDAIIIEGAAKSPVWVRIEDDKVSIEDAGSLWGKGTVDTTKAINDIMGKEACIAAIGQAGEKQRNLASIVNSVNHSAGGHGGILGAKNLKAIGIIGKRAVHLADENAKEWLKLNEYMMSDIIGANNQHVVPNTPQPWAEYHNPGSRWTAQLGLFWGAANPPVETGECPPGDKNKVGLRTQKAIFDLGPVAEERTIKMAGCYSCPIRCQSNMYMPELEKYGLTPYATSTCINYSSPGTAMVKGYADGESKGMDAMITKCLGSRLADDYGIWSNYGQLPRDFRHMYNSGKLKEVLPKEEYDSINFDLLEKGDPGWMLEYYNNLIGDGEFSHLLDGPYWMAQRWSMGDEYWNEYSNNIWSKMAYPKHHSNEAGAQVGVLVNIMFNRDANSHTHMNFIGAGLPIGLLKEIAGEVWGSPDALDAPKDYTPMNEYKAKFAKWSIDRNFLHDSITLCNWVWPMVVSPSKSRNYRGDTALESKFFSLATGIETSEEELDYMAERICTLHRAATIKQMATIDMRNEHDTIPEWVFNVDPDMEPFTEGTVKLDRDDMQLALTMLYKEYGWDEKTGAPTRATYEKLGLKDVADELEGLNLLP
ncbi:aldehyde ferredoxin oxidoreductase [Sedimentibacter hydroxybenzoicus DSM 7310]|uniref:Aldehyde ferredoxin oxidoreductase n=1 Tax=Sedimentibacter hydroxybenzoicus DSM 7310 TaxID=1123245 RepID=A0A974BLN6_SEDHY|nr:aldehyde ferredoxin oxidoreductase [Sedimentibacter hydroxybenzoicus]NYB75131.1 aldehyde ferredoxin oxidoreductase [Sedimentibacter hydroxybenzoicus DSM 7310]